MHSTQQTHRLPGLIVTGHEFQVPLDHARPQGEKIGVFAREVVAADKSSAELPWLLYLQGGPGFESPRPFGNNGWLGRALQEYRVLLLDQRGTGRSTPIGTETLAQFPTAQALADYLTHFRADAIVQDAEWIRRALVGEAPWSVLGQSFGGFCVTHYLSAAPEGLREAFITGGLPPLDRPATDVYRATYRRVLEQNRRYYERYPEDEALAREILHFLEAHEVRLPNGDQLSPRRFQQLGLALGANDGFEQIHYLLETAFVSGPHGRTLSYPFLRGVENALAFDTNPIFAILHEAIYCQQEASNWAAQRVLSEYPQFTPTSTARVHFTGEMIYPWMFEAYGALRPWKEAADTLARHTEWPRLYHIPTLQENRVPCAAAIYYDDMYVERAFSEETAQNIAGIRVWVTNEYVHNGLRVDGERILDRLIGMVRGQV